MTATRPPSRRRAARASATLAAAFALAGCASFSPDGGAGAVSALTQPRIGQPVTVQRTAEPSAAVRQRVTELLAQPLTADGAVQLALLNNRDLQARYAELGIAEADLVRAGRLPNPSLRFGRLSGNGSTEYDRAVLFDVLGLLTRPWAREAEQRRFEAVQWQAAAHTVQLAAQARAAWVDAVAAQQLATYAAQVQDAADATGELARRMQQAGHFSELARLREQAFQAESALQLARTQQQALASRERLVRVLGLDRPESLALPERLPDLPAQPLAPQQAEQAAIDQRLDVLAARRATEATAQALGLTRATRFVNVLQAGYQNKSESGNALAEGYEIELELPLFDFGATRAARAEAIYLQAVHHTAAVAQAARSEVRETYAAYRAAYEAARRHRDELVPLRQRIAEENLLRYNGMLISVFDLLAGAREQVQGVAAAVQALREHWLAENALQVALTAGPPPPATGSPDEPPRAPRDTASH